MDENPTVLVTGATGFIGRRLVNRLAQQGVSLRCLSRQHRPDTPGRQYCQADLFDRASLAVAMSGIKAAYYLVHSLDSGQASFAEKDRLAAENFVAAAEAAGVRQVIYLSGLGQGEGELSDHLKSRQEVAEILAAGKYQATVLRAAIIIGAGGSSFEMLRFLVKTQPVIPDPPQLDTLCQPIAVDNVIYYLAGCLQQPKTQGRGFDIGGPDVLSYRDMLKVMAEVSKTFNLYLPVPKLSAWLAGRFIGLLSGVDGNVAQALLHSLPHQVLCREDDLKELLPQRLHPYRESVEIAFAEKAAAGGNKSC